MWEVEFTDEFEAWWNNLTVAEQVSVDAVVRLLMEQGIDLGFPYCSGIKGAKHGHMRELRIKHQGRPYRVMYAFDPRRCAILLIGGDKTGINDWYEIFIPLADDIYDRHLAELKKEGLL